MLAAVTHLLLRALNTAERQAEDRVMKSLVKVLILLGIGASLAGCVVAPYGRHRGYVAAPVVVVHPCCERRW